MNVRELTHYLDTYEELNYERNINDLENLLFALQVFEIKVRKQVKQEERFQWVQLAGII